MPTFFDGVRMLLDEGDASSRDDLTADAAIAGTSMDDVSVDFVGGC